MSDDVIDIHVGRAVELYCAGIMHVFCITPGLCQCGEHYWHDGKTTPARPRLRLVEPGPVGQ